LTAAGIRKGDKVVFWSENRPEWIVAFWGCLLGGVIVVPIDYRASLEFLVRIVGRVAARVVLVGEDVPPVPPSLDAPVWRLHQLEWRDAAPLMVAIARDDVAEIIFTSGATGEPKGVVITHRNVLANILPVEHEVRKHRAWARPVFPLRFLNLLPLSHMFGQAMATFIPPMLPGVVVFMRGYNPADIVALIRRRRVSVLVSVPKILDVLRTHALRASPDAALASAKQSLRTARFSCGATTSPAGTSKRRRKPKRRPKAAGSIPAISARLRPTGVCSFEAARRKSSSRQKA
jgi:long-chain acyl-CoA synthetase